MKKYANYRIGNMYEISRMIENKALHNANQLALNKKMADFFGMKLDKLHKISILGERITLHEIFKLSSDEFEELLPIKYSGSSKLFGTNYNNLYVSVPVVSSQYGINYFSVIPRSLIVKCLYEKRGFIK